MFKKVKSIIVVGCGLHFKERHYKVLKLYAASEVLEIKLLIDLESEKEKIHNFFADKTLAPEKYLFLPNELRNITTINDIELLINGIHSLQIAEIDGILICTEPKSHKPYALWAINHHLHVFADKPLTAFDSHHKMNTLYLDYLEILEATQKNKINFVLCCERRGHFGYEFLKKYIGDIVNEYKVPITFIDIHYGDGLWNMPDEYSQRENHPYKYGYGVLLHSGYHYIDLLMSFVYLNRSIAEVNAKSCDLQIMANTPFNSLPIIKNEVYQSLLNTDRFSKHYSQESMDSVKYFGETDVIITGRFRNANTVITNFSLKLLQSTMSQRSWNTLPENTYLGNGRVHQENLIIHIGPLCSLHIRINPYSKIAPDQYSIEDFTIDIMSNSDLLKVKPLQRYTREDISKLYPNLGISESMNIQSRASQLRSFLQGNDGGTSLADHKNSIEMLDRIYRKIQDNIYNDTWH